MFLIRSRIRRPEPHRHAADQRLGSLRGSDDPVAVRPGPLRIDSAGMAIYTPAPRPRGHREEALEPEITGAPDILSPGSHHKVSGRRFNGVSQAVSYGDDCSCATNYPIARLRYAHGHVVYCRTYGHSTMAVATGHKPVHTTIEVPASAPFGAARLEIVANGVGSDGISVHVR